MTIVVKIQERIFCIQDGIHTKYMKIYSVAIRKCYIPSALVRILLHSEDTRSSGPGT